MEAPAPSSHAIILPDANHSTARFRRSPASLSDDGDALDFDEHAGMREPGYGDERARGEIVAEDVAADFGEVRAAADIGDEHGHRHHVGEPPAGLLQGLAEA